jgi:dTDP-4-amino-4,6-dideoxygalactose transaminase
MVDGARAQARNLAPASTENEHDGCRDLLSRDSRIRFVVPVHLYGHCIDLERLEVLREEFDLRIVEDCAQAIGARCRRHGVGTVGQVAAVSFYPTKNLGALGDGGAVLTADDAIARRARALRHYGQSAPYVHHEAGLNSRLDELHEAVLGDVFLPRLTRWTARWSDVAAPPSERPAEPGRGPDRFLSALGSRRRPTIGHLGNSPGGGVC